MDSAEIRRARASDRDDVGALWIDLLDEQEALDDRLGVADDALERWENDFPLWLEDDTRRLFVADLDGEIIGFASARRWAPAPVYRDQAEVFLDEVYVDHERRRQGIGTQLVNAVEVWADDVEAYRVRLRALSANEEALAFWKTLNANPLSVTFTIDRPGPDDPESDEGSAKIGF